jgi:hypothetical protein
MTPQSSFMVLAPVDPLREAELRRLLDSMNDAPGRLKKPCPLVPFHDFETLHVARLFLVDDKTTGDVAVYGIPPRRYPLYLAFLGDVDGTADEFYAEVARHAPEGLRALYSCCMGFGPGADLALWMRAHHVSAAASYVNWRGRTVKQAREEAALREALAAQIRADGLDSRQLAPREVHRELRAAVKQARSSGRLTLSPAAATPLGFKTRNLVHLVAVPLLLLLASPLLLVLALVALVRLRRLEKTDPELCPRSDPAASAELSRLEDHDVTNQFTAMGSLKPGPTRRWVTRFVLLVIDYTARHVYTRGRLARVRTIHFARWVFIDDRQRIIFLSNYDGSLESYMDDFINKVGFGLNLVFSNGIGYPRASFLVRGGSRDERKFKEYLRRHQIPTQVWYKAYPGLTAVDLERNLRIRQGLEATELAGPAAREWVALL